MTRSMTRPLLFAAVALIVSATARPAAQDVAGRWTGRMEPTNLSAEIDLDLRRAGTAWTGALVFRAGANGGTLPMDELRVDGDRVRVRTKIEGAEVNLDVALADGLMLGSVRVTENGRVLAEGPAGVARVGDANGRTRLTDWLDAHAAGLDARTRDAIIKKALDLFAANYVFEDRAQRAVADVRARAARGEYDTATNPARFAELISRHLADATGDGHVRLKLGADRVADPSDAGTETAADIAQLRRDAEAERFGIGPPRVLEGNVGYFAFTRFVRAEFAGDALAAVLQKLATTDALIVDLRESGGGDQAMVVLAASWFFDGRPRHWNDLIRRFDGATIQFWTAAWLPGPRYTGKPLYILTAPRTFSAPESLAYELQQSKRATIVGERTGGGAHAGAWFPLEGRFSIFIPRSRYVSAVSGGDWEGTGVTPDVPCAAADALERAHQLARRR